MPAIAVPAITEPYVAIAPLPRAPEETAPPAAPVAHPAPPATPHPVPAASPDAMADLKQHVTNEVQAGIENVKEQRQRAERAHRAEPDGRQRPGRAAQIDQSRTLVQRVFANGRGFLAAFLSLITLILTESHDLLAWTNTTGPTQAPQLSAAHGPAQAAGPAQDVYQFMGRARDWTTETYVTLHNFRGDDSNDWIFRAESWRLP